MEVRPEGGNDEDARSIGSVSSSEKKKRYHHGDLRAAFLIAVGEIIAECALE